MTTKAVHLQLIGNGTPEPFIGVHGVPGRLPELLRYPGESSQAFCKRCLHLVSGSGSLWAKLMYASEVPPAQGTPTDNQNTGHSEREIALVDGVLVR
ncbi:MAG: hypothetical protein Q7U28_06675 [Aquabacterium sp.]|nr:hypothetical protein [Aquabacterium sp.]